MATAANDTVDTYGPQQFSNKCYQSLQPSFISVTRSVTTHYSDILTGENRTSTPDVQSSPALPINLTPIQEVTESSSAILTEGDSRELTSSCSPSNPASSTAMPIVEDIGCEEPNYYVNVRNISTSVNTQGVDNFKPAIPLTWYNTSIEPPISEGCVAMANPSLCVPNARTCTPSGDGKFPL